MDSCEIFDETSLAVKKAFYGNLNMKGIKEVDYRHAKKKKKKKKIKEFNIKILCEYHDLYDQSDTLLLADVFENFVNKFIERYELDPTHFLSAPGLA